MTLHSSITLNCGRHRLSLANPLVMGILNVTPDSFSDGGRFAHLDRALKHAESMLKEGAHIIDVGGESTRPGAKDVNEAQEMERVIPVIEALVARFDAVISVDTSKASVISAAAQAGATFINDVRALREPGALKAAAASRLPVCLMHMLGEPGTMQNEPHYQNVVEEVGDFLSQRLADCLSEGMDVTQVLIDPGFGFGKNYNHNWQLLRGLRTLRAIAPVLTGLSRKRMLAQALGSDTDDRTVASAAAAMLCVQHGASIVRVHDVASTVQALAVLQATLGRD
ncbi:MAG: dihydropteroate synthase [Gammaproteobacteria bacterium]|nr:dihydropteroate synthase [Gammaproteobacteria bacterium]